MHVRPSTPGTMLLKALNMLKYCGMCIEKCIEQDHCIVRQLQFWNKLSNVGVVVVVGMQTKRQIHKAAQGLKQQNSCITALRRIL